MLSGGTLIDYGLNAFKYSTHVQRDVHRALCGGANESLAFKLQFLTVPTFRIEPGTAPSWIIAVVIVRKCIRFHLCLVSQFKAEAISGQPGSSH